MPKTVSLTLPWPPTANLYYRHAVVGRRAVTYLSEDGREYKQLVKMVIREQKVPHFGLARIMVDVTAFPPDKAARDLDNLWKPLFDALSDELETKKQAARHPEDARRRVLVPGLWRNDSQIDDERMRRGQVVAEGRIVITVTELAEVAEQLEFGAAPAEEEMAEEPF